MTFIMKKKKYKFNIEVLLDELNCVPFINALLFAKLRLLEGGSFTQTTARNEVIEHSVRWKSKYSFVCKMSANASSGILDSCQMRISIRKEEKGGRTYQKLGFVDIDLAQFAGCGLTTRRYLLEGYNEKKHRQDNSTLKIQIDCTLVTGDPLFKRPSKTSSNLHVPTYGSGASSKDNTINNQLESAGEGEGAGVAGPLAEPRLNGPLPTLGENNNLVGCSDNNTLSRQATLKEETLFGGQPSLFPLGLIVDDGDHPVGPVLAGQASAGVGPAKQGDDCHSGESISSGFGSLPRSRHEQKHRQQVLSLVGEPDQEDALSQIARTSHYSEGQPSHSRQSSAEDAPAVDPCRLGSSDRLKQLQQSTLPFHTSHANPQYSTLQPTQLRNKIGGGEFSSFQLNGKSGARRRGEFADNVNNKVDATRVDCEDIVNEIIESQLRENDISLTQDSEVGLELFVAKDGTAKLGSKSRPKNGRGNPMLAHSNPNSRPSSSIELLRTENS